MKYKKKPVIIDAVQWHGRVNNEILELGIGIGVDAHMDLNRSPDSLYIQTLEGEHECRVGDYLIKGIKGEFYPCKPDIFEMTYEKV